MEEFDCKKCLHEKVCALWASRESQNASCFCTDGCDYFTPTLTPPNEPLTLEELREMEQSTPVWWDYIPCWVLVRRGSVLVFGSEPHKVENLFGYFYRRPPEGEEDT